MRRRYLLILLPLILGALACKAAAPGPATPSRQPPTPVYWNNLTPVYTATHAPALLAAAQSVPATTTPSPPHASAICVVTTGQPGGHANLRAGASMAYPAIAWATEGDRLPLAGDPQPGAAWLHVHAGELTGWIYADLCEVTK